jgi:hypothetical protein
MTEQQISNRGLEASQVLGNPAYVEAMQMLRQSIVAKWKECSLRDPEGQVLTLQMMKLADTFEALLAGMVEAGKFAQHQIDLNEARNESAARKLMRRVL